MQGKSITCLFNYGVKVKDTHKRDRMDPGVRNNPLGRESKDLSWARSRPRRETSPEWDKKSRVCGTGDSVSHEAQLERNGGKC